jgi:Bacterial regulatory protein, Fis family
VPAGRNFRSARFCKSVLPKEFHGINDACGKRSPDSRAARRACCCNIPGPATFANWKTSFPPHASLPRAISSLSDLPEHLQHRTPRLPGVEDWQPLSLEEVRKVHIQKVLQMCNGNRLRAAQILGIGRTTLYRYLKRDGYEARPRAHTSIASA